MQPYISAIAYNDVLGRISSGATIVVAKSEYEAKLEAIRVATDVIGPVVPLHHVVDAIDRPIVLYNTRTKQYYRCTITLEAIDPPSGI